MTTSDFQAFAQRVLEKHRARAADTPGGRLTYCGDKRTRHVRSAARTLT